MTTLADLVPGGGRRRAGIFARHEGQFLFVGERTQRAEGDLACIRVGGGCRPEESLTDCARREAREEIGCEVSLQHSHQTFVVDERGSVTVYSLDAPPAPLLVYTRRRPDETPPCFHNVVFAASLAAAPRPGPEAETLLLLSEEALLALAEGPRPLSSLQAADARVESLSPPSPAAIVFAEPAALYLAALLRQGLQIK